MTKELLEKLKELGVSDSDLLSITEAFNKKLDESVSLKLEEETKKLEVKYDEDYKKKLSESLATEKTKLEEEFSNKAKELEESMLNDLDNFLEFQVNEKISEELIDSAGINEADKKIIAGIRHLFETEYVALDVEGKGLLEKKDQEIASKSKELDEAIAEKISLAKELDEAKKVKLVSEKTVNLSETQKKRVNDLFEGKDFKFTSEKLDSFIALIKEEKTNKEENKEKLNENKSAISADDKIITEKKEEKKPLPKNSILMEADAFL